jgi:hypothetical protein
MVIRYGDNSTSNSSHTTDRVENEDHLVTVIGSRATRTDVDITTGNRSHSSLGSRKITEIFENISDISEYSDILIDVSAFPLDLYFPLIGKLLHIVDNAKKESLAFPNLHVIVAENQKIDSYITDIEIEARAKYLFSFASKLGTESNKQPNVWIPVLGENTDIQLEKIKTLVNPIEICPLIPSPSLNPRRGDDLILEYADLFDKMEIEIGNFIYGSEQNPFEAYRQIMYTIRNYPQILASIGGCKIAISSLTSKLLSIAPLLVAYECKQKKDLSVGIAHISSKEYDLDMKAKEPSIINKSELFSLWLAGDCYNE